MTNKPFAKGQCLCGAVKYTLNTKPSFMAQCHCKDCQRATGSGHVSMAFFEKNTIELEGQLNSYSVTTDRGNTLTRSFCPTCGSRMLTENSANPDTRGIGVGTIDDNSWFSPDVVVYTKYRHAWDITTDEVPNFEEMSTK